MTHRLTTLFTATLIACAALPASAATYQLGYLNGLGGANTNITGVNDAGRVVGISQDADQVAHATTWTTRTPTKLDSDTTVYYGQVPNIYYTEPNYGSYAYGINQSGAMAGWMWVAYPGNVGSTHAVTWNGSTTTDITPYTSAMNNAKAYGLNDRNQIVGSAYVASAGTQHAMLWNGASVTDLGSLGGSSVASGINNRGKVIGQASVALSPDEAPATHAFSWNNGHMTDLGTLGGRNSNAFGVNGAGLVAGYAETPTGHHTTVWNGTTPIDLLPTSGSDFSIAVAINNFGQVVGSANVDIGLNYGHAMLWNGTTAFDLNILVDPEDVETGWILSVATGINDRGWIVGDAYNTFTDETRGFLLNPLSDTMVDYTYMFATSVSEPDASAMATASATLLALSAFLQRRRHARGQAQPS